MHSCTYISPDPEFVLAMRITKETYPIYEAFPVMNQLSFKKLKNSFLVVPTTEVGWGLWKASDFNKEYISVTMLIDLVHQHSGFILYKLRKNSTPDEIKQDVWYKNIMDKQKEISNQAQF